MFLSRVSKLLIILVNSLLVLVIVGVIVATWMPAIYTSEWFGKTDWTAVYQTGVSRGRRGVMWLALAGVVLLVVWIGAVLLRRRRAGTTVIEADRASPHLPSR